MSMKNVSKKRLDWTVVAAVVIVATLFISAYLYKNTTGSSASTGDSVFIDAPLPIPGTPFCEECTYPSCTGRCPEGQICRPHAYYRDGKEVHTGCECVSKKDFKPTDGVVKVYLGL